jgi:tellurite methyltransferase
MDKEYWNKYYLNHGKDKEIAKQSTFSEFCQNKYFYNNKFNIVELGSGNGRDAIYFAHHGHQVVAIDQSVTVIDMERSKISTDVNNNLKPIAADFIRDDFCNDPPIDVFYSRFTLHAITKEDERVLLPKVFNNISNNGLFCIEARTTMDQLYRIGDQCGDNTYMTDHKRRFIDSVEFLNKVLEIGFSLVYFTEENNLSIYKDDNPVLMRIILRKRIS